MLGIICALRSEAPRLAPERKETAVVVVSGVGRENAARAAEELAARRPLRGLISAGYAGALSPDVGIGDLVVDTAVQEWRELAQRAGHQLGRVATVDHVITTIAQRRELAARTGALAVDMESSAVAEVAVRRGLPWASVRAVTDTAARDMTLDWNGCRRPDGSFRLLSLAGQALAKPSGVAELRQLWYASRIASRNLRVFLGELLGEHRHSCMCAGAHAPRAAVERE